ncbi:MAG: nitroreductase [Proteobacteria bacterium]|nr:nitroreductase [Pseudomonadota bacterium]
MTVTDAVTARRAVRSFAARAVDPALIRRLVALAARAPSGGNLQPWHIDVLGGETLAAFRREMVAKIAAGHRETPTYAIYPPELDDPYEARRVAIGEAMYGYLGIPRDDRAARRHWFARNFDFFGAPLALFCTVSRTMGPPQWSDLGMYLQTLMLLLVEHGLASCPQECWAMYPETVTDFLGTPPERMLFCGMAIGYEDKSHPTAALRSDRAPLEEWARFRF